MDLETKKALIHKKAANFNNQSLLDSYKSLERATMWSYHNDNTLSKLSSDFDVAMLHEGEKKIAESLLSNGEFISVLIYKMLNHDSIISYSMYRMLYKNSFPALVIEDGDIFENETLIATFLDKGGDSAALGEMNAELWLTSKIGESYLMENGFEN